MIISGSDLLQGNTPWKIWFVIAACLIISSVTWTLTSLAVSACTDNLFVVVLSPMLLLYLLHAIMLIIMKISYDPIYDSLDYYYLGRGITPISDPAKAILTTCQWYLPVIVAALAVFFGFAVRRSQYE